jgi:glycosyltransferase involved in cell wall biosynthesis
LDKGENIITVLLTVYNRLSVKNTIESVLEQSFKDFQLLIIDNASDDGTYELLIDYEKKDKRVKIVRNEKNMGQTYSLHKGMELAEGKYIARIDADDLMHKDRLKKQFEFLENNPEYGVCGSWVQFITDDDRKAFIIKTATSDNALRVIQRIGCGIYHPAAMMRRELLIKNNIKYDESLKMAEDYDMWRQILSVSKGLNLPEVLLLYRRGNSNDSKSHIYETRKEDRLVREKICKEESYLGKEYIGKILHLEKQYKKNILQTFSAYRWYKKYLDVNIKKDDENYTIIMSNIRTRLLGKFIIENTTCWARILTQVYKLIRDLRYKMAK